MLINLVAIPIKDIIILRTVLSFKKFKFFIDAPFNLQIYHLGLNMSPIKLLPKLSEYIRDENNFDRIDGYCEGHVPTSNNFTKFDLESRMEMKGACLIWNGAIDFYRQENNSKEKSEESPYPTLSGIRSDDFLNRCKHEIPLNHPLARGQLFFNPNKAENEKIGNDLALICQKIKLMNIKEEITGQCLRQNVVVMVGGERPSRDHNNVIINKCFESRRGF